MLASWDLSRLWRQRVCGAGSVSADAGAATLVANMIVR